MSKNTGAHPRSRGENGAAAGEVSARRGSSPLTRGKLTFPISCKGGGGLIPAHAGKTTPCPAPSTWAWAHPRSRGENNAPLEMAIFQRGSSPLTRGKPRACHAVLAPSGLIPAHAGKTYSSMVLWKLLRAHPRSRGENDLVAGEALLEPGSSPLTRGKHDTRVSRVLLDGLIPAHAGKTSRAADDATSAEAHPRSRGENLRFEGCDLRAQGSSPLTRGKRLPRPQTPAAHGLIPAHAGKTSRAACLPPSSRAHPRSRGENALEGLDASEVEGSSPLTRGKHAAPHSTREQIGLIPAHAGKTVPCVAATCHLRAHPRSRGENQTHALPERPDAGSSPLTRGKRRQRQVVLYRRGLIPAHAGKTNSLPRGARRWRAHPRSRGENHPLLQEQDRVRGSSPLTRGKPVTPGGESVKEGLIPAHAGKTRSPRSRRNNAWAHPRSRGENA